MGVRLQSTFYSEREHEYTISIYDSLYSDTPLEFECINCVISYDFDGDEDDRFSPIISSTAKVSIIINTNDLETFTTDLLSAPEDRFYVLIEDDETPTEFRWVGYILPDQVVHEDIPVTTGYEFLLTAKDGFNWLKTAEYKDDGGIEYLGYDTLKNHILNALDKLPFLDEIYGSGNTYIKFLMTWYEHYMQTDILGNYNQLNHLRIHHRAFKWKDSNGNKHYRSCYDVLKYIAIVFGARWIFSGRYIYFIQVNEYDTSEATKTWWNMRNDAVTTLHLGTELLVIENNQTTLDNTEIIREGGGLFKYYPALKEVTIKYEHIGTRNFLAGEEYNDDENPESQRKILSEFDPTFTEAFLSIRFTLYYDSTYLLGSAHTAHYLVFGFKVIDAGFVEDDFATTNNGTYKRDVIFDGNTYTYTAPIWTTDTNEYYKIVVPVQYAGQRYIVTEAFSVADLPNAYGFGLEFDLVEAYTLDGFPLSLGKLEYNWHVDTMYAEYVSLQFFGEQNDILEYKAINDEYATKLYDKTSILGDGPSLNSPGRIDVWDGTQWIRSSSSSNLKWSSPNIEEKNISQLLANEIISSQLSPVKYFADMSFIVENASNKFLLPHYAIKYDGEYWVFQGGEILLFDDRVRGNWWKINYES